MPDLFPEINERMAQYRAGLQRRRTMRRAYNSFRERKPWRWLPDDQPLSNLILTVAFRFLGIPKELRRG